MAELGLPVPLTVGLPPPEDRGFADVWSALGGELKPSIDVVVSAPINTGQQFEVGPPVTTPPLFNFGGSADCARVRARQVWASAEPAASAVPNRPDKPGRAGKPKRGGKTAEAARAAARRVRPDRATDRPKDQNGRASGAAEAAEETNGGRTGAQQREPAVDERAGVPPQTIRGPSSGGPTRVSMRRRAVMIKRTS